MPSAVATTVVLTPTDCGAISTRSGRRSLRQVCRAGLLSGGLIALAVQLVQPTALRALLSAAVQPNAALAASDIPTTAGRSGALGSLPPLN
jgi:hypothetical protein